ncbi:MAG: DUF4410 domain-containing protein [Akkermansiaceae bacterium]
MIAAVLALTHSIKLAAVCAVGLLLASCASVSVKEARFAVQKKALQAPSRVFVRPFTFDGATIDADRAGVALVQFKTDVSNQMAEELAERINKHIAPATVVKPEERVTTPGAWLVEGRFIELKQGSRLLRSLIGFGSGRTKMETIVSVFKINSARKKELLGTIETTGGSNAEPGAAFTGPVGFAPRAILQASNSGVSADSRRTARMITAVLSEELGAAGAPLAGQALRVKRLQTEQ